MELKVGDTVQIEGFTGSYWDGAVCEVLAVKGSKYCPYSLKVITASYTQMVGKVGSFSDKYLQLVSTPKPKKDYRVEIKAGSDIDYIHFELQKKSSSEYWDYIATLYIDTASGARVYHVNGDDGTPVGHVMAICADTDGVVWGYDDGPMGTVEGTAKSFKKAILALTKSAQA